MLTGRTPAPAVVLLALAGCRSSGAPEWTWPPADFFLEVRARIDQGGVLRDLQSFHVFADGLAIYREAESPAGAGSDAPAVFDCVCAYRMQPESMRTLARQLNRVGLFSQRLEIGPAGPPEVTSIRWRAFGGGSDLVARGAVYGEFVDVLHVVNSFLPPGRAFEVPDMTGEPGPPRLARVPEPHTDLEGSYRAHMEWRKRLPDDVDWLLETFALAVAVGDRAGAELILADLGRLAARDPDGGTAEALLESLRRRIPP